MELIITEKLTNPTICLNMIVKNESHIIKKTLENLCSKIDFSYWVICDTGSTDNTCEIIVEFFSNKNILGELHKDEWQDFAHNRTLALQKAFEKSDLLLVFDADDEIVGLPVLPGVNATIYDEYHLKFGSPLGTAYTRVLLVNNRKRFVYQSVIHEYICCVEPANVPRTNAVIQGDYYIVSGRSGSRSLDPEKYLKDAKILETAHAEAVLKNDPLFKRYAFYCANSYKDYGSLEDAIKWYKITLGQENWAQEHYMSCFHIYECYQKLNQVEQGFFYLVKAFQYDQERVECLYPLLVYYCCEGQYKMAYNYYLQVKDFYEIKYLSSNVDGKLFVSIDKYNFFVPYYMILIADKIKDNDCIIKMFEIVFTKKMPVADDYYVGNILFNLQFFVQHVKTENKEKFINLATEYIRFLSEMGLQLQRYEFLREYKTQFGIDVSYLFSNLVLKNKMNFSKEECKKSKNILIYTGLMYFLWNDTYVSTKSIGGAEKAVAYLFRYFSKEYNIFISGDVEDEVIDNVTYINRDKLQNLLEKTKFHTIIVSRYISFFLMYNNFSCYKLFLSAHDSTGFINNYNNNRLSLNDIVETWNPIIDGCIALTTWHKNNIIERHPCLKDKIHIINNGILPEIFPLSSKKIRNKFVWTSCSYRGLHVMLNLWKDILESIPDATLDIASYDIFPKNADDLPMQEVIVKYSNSIKHRGKLNTSELNNLISTAEYWLYTNTFPETSCITGMEMLMSEVICLYYPLAGLLDTVGEYGIQVNPGSEVDTILNLTEKQKIIMRKRGKDYALTCSWENKAKEWENVLFSGEQNGEQEQKRRNTKQKVAIFNSLPFHYEMFGYIIYFCKENNKELTIFTNFDNNIGWLDFYTSNFKKYNFNLDYKHFSEFEKDKDQFDLIFVTTDDDPKFMSEWINSKCICIDHTIYNRSPKFVNKLGTRAFINSDIKWAIPCFPALNIEDKINLNTNECINIAIIGCYRQYNYDIVNRLYNDKKIILHIVGRYADIFNVNNISNKNIECKIYSNLNTGELFELFKICDYLLTDITINTDHIIGISMSGSIPLAFSTLTPLIISKQNNALYKFKNVIEFDLETNDIININKNVINYGEFVEERKNLISMLSSYIDELKNEVIYLRFFSDEGVTNTLEHWMSIEKLETLYNNKVILTNGDNYTHAIIINTCMPKLNIPKQNIIGISHEPNIMMFMNKDKQLFIEYAQKHIDKYFVGDVGDLPKPFIEGQSYFFYNKSNFYYEAKNKFCSFVISEKNVSFHDTLNYKYRHDLVKEILTTNLPIDIYGHGIKLYNDYNDLRIKHPLEWSLDNPFGTIPFEKYKFHICIENVNSNHYFSEKIINPLLSNVIPIYYGCKNIDNYFNNNNIIKLSGDTKKDVILLGQLFQDRDKDKEQFTDNYQSILNTTNIFNNLHKLFDNITLKNNNIKIYVIHYKKLHERKEFMINQFKRENIFNYEFITIDRDELTENDTKNFQQNMSKPLIANFLSHLYAYKQIETNLFDYNLILEDDAVLCSNFSNILQSYVNQFSNDYDAVFIGNGANIMEHRIEASKIIKNSNVYKYDGENKCKCTDSYFISKKGACHIINYFNTLKIKIDEAIDWFINKPFKSSNVYWCEPPIVKQGTIIGLFNSSVGNGMLIYTGFNPNVLTCYKSPFKKIRVGKDFDGGYVICDIPNINYDLLLGCGVDVDISFESQFCNKYKNALCYLYDGSVNDIYLDNKNITFLKKYINDFNDENNTNLHEIIDKFNNIFLKMDIEGYEIPWIKSLSDEKLNKISQIVMEFHFPFEDYKKDVFEKINKYFIMIHFHANNCCGVRNHNGIIIPNVFECTYLNRKFFNNNYELNTDVIPSVLDMKNVYEHDEIYIDYEPFVNK